MGNIALNLGAEQGFKGLCLGFRVQGLGFRGLGGLGSFVKGFRI